MFGVVIRLISAVMDKYQVLYEADHCGDGQVLAKQLPLWSSPKGLFFPVDTGEDCWRPRSPPAIAIIWYCACRLVLRLVLRLVFYLVLCLVSHLVLCLVLRWAMHLGSAHLQCTASGIVGIAVSNWIFQNHFDSFIIPQQHNMLLAWCVLRMSGM